MEKKTALKKKAVDCLDKLGATVGVALLLTYAEVANAGSLTGGGCRFYNNYLNNDLYAFLAGIGGLGLVAKNMLDEGDQKLKSSASKWMIAGGAALNIPTIAGLVTNGSFCNGASASISIGYLNDLIMGLAQTMG